MYSYNVRINLPQIIWAEFLLWVKFFFFINIPIILWTNLNESLHGSVKFLTVHSFSTF